MNVTLFTFASSSCRMDALKHGECCLFACCHVSLAVREPHNYPSEDMLLIECFKGGCATS